MPKNAIRPCAASHRSGGAERDRGRRREPRGRPRQGRSGFAARASLRRPLFGPEASPAVLFPDDDRRLSRGPGRDPHGRGVLPCLARGRTRTALNVVEMALRLASVVWVIALGEGRGGPGHRPHIAFAAAEDQPWNARSVGEQQSTGAPTPSIKTTSEERTPRSARLHRPAEDIHRALAVETARATGAMRVSNRRMGPPTQGTPAARPMQAAPATRSKMRPSNSLLRFSKRISPAPRTHDCVWTAFPQDGACVSNCGALTNEAGAASVQSVASRLCQAFSAQGCKARDSSCPYLGPFVCSGGTCASIPRIPRPDRTKGPGMAESIESASNCVQGIDRIAST